MQNGNGRFVDADGRATLIKNGTLYIIDDTDKSYVVFDKATMEQLAKKINEAMEKMKEQLAQAATRAARADGTDDARHVGQRQQVDRGSHRHRQIRQGRWAQLPPLGRQARRRARRPDLRGAVLGSLPGKENFQAVFANFAKVFEEMAKSVPMLAGMMTNEFSAQAKVNGFPVRTRGYEDGKLGDDEQVMKVWREEAIPASMFEIPAGYKQKQMPMGAN